MSDNVCSAKNYYEIACFLRFIQEFELNLKNYVLKAKETLQKKHVINPKPQKRFMRIITENEESDQSNQDIIRPSTPPVPAVRNVDPVVVPAKPKTPQRESLRPVRTAKANASKNLVRNLRNFLNFISSYLNLIYQFMILNYRKKFHQMPS